MERTAKKEHQYDGRTVKAGEKFTVVDPQHVPVLIALGAIDPEPGELGYVEHLDSATSGTPTVRPTITAASARRRRG